MSVKVFLPFSCFNANSGILLGYYSFQKSCYYVLSVTDLEKYDSILANVNQALSPNDGKCEAFGLWLKSSENTDTNLIAAAATIMSRENWIILEKSNSNLSLICIQKKREIEIIQSQIGVVILYNEQYILDGKNLLPKFEKHLKVKSSNKLIAAATFPTSESNGDCKQNIDLSHVADTEMILFLYAKVLKYRSNYRSACSANMPHGIILVSNYFHQIWIKLCFVNLLWLVFVKIFTLFKCYLFDNLAHFSSIGTHLSLKIKLLHSLCMDDTSQQQKRDVASSIAVDCFFGILFCYWIVSYSSLWFYASELLMPSVDVIAKNVSNLQPFKLLLPIYLIFACTKG